MGLNVVCETPVVFPQRAGKLHRVRASLLYLSRSSSLSELSAGSTTCTPLRVFLLPRLSMEDDLKNVDWGRLCLEERDLLLGGVG